MGTHDYCIWLFNSIQYFISGTSGSYTYVQYWIEFVQGGLPVFTYTIIYDILFYCLKDTLGTIIDSSFELVNVHPGKFPETRDSIQNEHLFSTTISFQL